MRSILDLINLKPTDEKVMTKNPEFNKVTEDMQDKKSDQPKYEGSAFSVFTNKDSLDKAIHGLQAHEFLSKEITILTAHEGNLLDYNEPLIESKIGEGAMFGALSGIVTGLVWGMFSSYHIAVVNNTFISTFFNSLFFATIFAMIFGLIGTMIGRLIPQYKNERYDTKLPDGQYLVIIKAVEADRLDLAKQVLSTNNGRLIKSPEELQA